MLLGFVCSKCRTAMEVDATLSGTAVTCAQCGTRLTVPPRVIGPAVTLGGFRILKLLNRGGMGEVYLATQLSLGREVALKILPPTFVQDHDSIERFYQEVRILANLNHPHIVTAYEAGEDGGIRYLAMAYVKGGSVESRLKAKGAYSEYEALRLGRSLAEALAYAWEKGRLLHRDVKPANVLLDEDGQAKLVDFGLSKSLAAGAVGVTMAPTIMGSPNYMSPEQAEGTAELDIRSDMYSLGATLYHMLTGKLPFAGTSLMETLKKELTEQLPDPRTHNVGVSSACVVLLEQMLARDREKRHAGWEELIRDIGRVLAGQFPHKAPLAAGESVMVREATISDVHRKKLKVNGQAIGERLHAAVRADAARDRDDGRHRTRLLVGWIAAGTVVVVGIIIGLIISSGGRTPPAGSSPSSAVVTTPAAVAAAPPVKGADKTEEMWASAVKYGGDHPQQFDAAIANFQTLKARAVGTKYEMMADEEIRRLEGAKKAAEAAALGKVMDELKAKAQTLVDADDWAGAAGVYASYSGALAAETEAQRKALADGYRARADERAKTRQAEGDAARRKVDAVLLATANDLLSGKATPAGSAWEALAQEPLPAGEQTRVKQAQELLRGWAAVDAAIRKSFEAQAGEDVSLVVDGKTQRLRIGGIRGDLVQSVRQVEGASIGFTFSVKQLSAVERMRRLEGRATPEVCALYAGLLAQAAGRAEDAAKTLADAGVLGPALQATLAATQQAQRDAVARQALAKVLQPLGVAGGSIDRVAIANRVQTAKLDAKVLSSVMNGLGAFKKEYGGTAFAVENQAATDQIVELLASLTAPPEVSAVPARQPVGAPPPVPMSRSPYRASPERLRAALMAVNSAYNGKGGEFHLDGGQITYAFLYAVGCITNIAPLKGLSLTYLNLGNCQNIQDFSPLAGMPLRELELDQCHFFDDTCLPLLVSMPLDTLILDGTPVKDIGALKGLRLRCFRAPRIADLEPLRGMPLEEFYCSVAENMTDLSPLKGMPLKKLTLGYARQLADITVVASLVSLEEFNCRESQVAEFAPLGALRSLKKLALGGKTFSDLTIVANMKELEALYIRDTAAGDLTPLTALRCLKALDIRGTPVTDLAPVLDKRLDSLAFDPRNIKNADQIKTLRSMKTLQRAGPRDYGMPVAEFWKRYDAGEFK